MSSRSPSSSSRAVPPGRAMAIDAREEATAGGCLPADQSCFALSAGSPYPSRRAAAAARACCSTTSYIVVLSISFGSLLAILLILCVIRWYLVHRSARQQEEEAMAAATDGAPGTAKKQSAGLDADAIAALPEFVYRKDGSVDEDEEEDAECAVCLAVMVDGEASRRLPRCMHVFHRSCVDVWLREHSTCPVCRAEVVIRPAGGECAGKEHVGSTSRALTSPPPPPREQVLDDGDRDLEAQ
ncbi:RING-H2 finger protein ATL2G [Hordeum vulgare]|uniref:RING-type E3 ubiquitin transferase n=1 Tax=Hordeum vulgare subsp. vulgare TaxID=112509 RepID=A0A8I6W583_HORVV|nr:RING-H2 finger protein ATL39-like [Hordeum vulgare subsp. vulgare]KAE8795327.1 RING-H2 finger protein ATL2G [Hordeum vulgare]KAI5021553.1 hypothetical protein ZWY2020_058283 [Hordeum vulgare]